MSTKQHGPETDPIGAPDFTPSLLAGTMAMLDSRVLAPNSSVNDRSGYSKCFLPGPGRWSGKNKAGRRQCLLINHRALVLENKLL